MKTLTAILVTILVTSTYGNFLKRKLTQNPTHSEARKCFNECNGEEAGRSDICHKCVTENYNHRWEFQCFEVCDPSKPELGQACDTCKAEFPDQPHPDTSRRCVNECEGDKAGSWMCYSCVSNNYPEQWEFHCREFCEAGDPKYAKDCDSCKARYPLRERTTNPHMPPRKCEEECKNEMGAHAIVSPQCNECVYSNYPAMWEFQCNEVCDGRRPELGRACDECKAVYPMPHDPAHPPHHPPAHPQMGPCDHASHAGQCNFCMQGCFGCHVTAEGHRVCPPTCSEWCKKDCIFAEYGRCIQDQFRHANIFDHTPKVGRCFDMCQPGKTEAECQACLNHHEPEHHW